VLVLGLESSKRLPIGAVVVRRAERKSKSPRGAKAQTFNEKTSRQTSAAKKPAKQKITPTEEILFRVEGKMSTFGGPRDTGMSADEGLALFYTG
jgi:hypothetical protein